MSFDPSKNSENKIYPSETNSFKLGTGAGDFLKMFQDPTVLGFKLFFENISSKGSVGTGLLGGETNPNSALFYLNKMGDTARVTMLEDFKNLLSKLNSEYPWYFQSIDGLSDAWSRDFSKAKFKKELTISCLESIDLRITALMDLYRKVAYDWENRRCILPDNLRQFRLTIKVYDIRNFQRDPGKYLDSKEINANKKEFNEQFLGNTIEDTTQVTFNLSHCEFMANDSGSVFSSVSNASYESASQTIKISYENINEDNIYRSLVALGKKNIYHVKDYLNKELDILTVGNINSKPTGFNIPGIEGSPGNDPNFFKKVQQDAKDKVNELKKFDFKDRLENLYEDIGTNISNDAASLVRSKINSLFLGNVYGFSASTLTGSADSAARIISDTATRNARKGVKDLGNTFGKGKN
tara:strand:- start:435 stop:1664 length:1230 start_codon:yes stop_codon:yes gene_type:complete